MSRSESPGNFLRKKASFWCVERNSKSQKSSEFQDPQSIHEPTRTSSRQEIADNWPIWESNIHLRGRNDDTLD